ncbi:hypothetical protein FOZ60_004494 [Perkinsus olseni]|uniref:Uncharacterized protein n=1 Tax=Perkinsus olseni TaxID=32597 RepID=A0A7J6PNA8_PEROL|nr:hypothetical protein FOZ60_004494 [Perkinsus olseni]
MRPAGLPTDHASKREVPSGHRPMRTMSVLSQQTCGALEGLDQQLTGVEAEVRAHGSSPKSRPTELRFAKLKAIYARGVLTAERAQHVLAQVEARLDKLQFKGIDEIETGNLHSGKETAKHARKELVRRAEMLSQRIESIFRHLHGSA